MARIPNPTAAPVDVVIDDATLQHEVHAANELSALVLAQQAGAVTLARELGYEGALTVGALEDEIRFFQKRSVEALLEAGKRLLLLKEVTPHGDFYQRVELLGFSTRTAQRFMQAASKTAKSAILADLSKQAKNGLAFLELVTHDDDVIEDIAKLDDIDRLSASQLRAKVREMKIAETVKDRLLQDNQQKLNEQAVELEKAISQAFTPPPRSVARTRAEQALLTAVTQSSGRAYLRMRTLFEAVNAALSDDGSVPEAIQQVARQSIEFLAQQLADMAQEFGISVNLEERISPNWFDEEALAALEARNAAAGQ